jgi:molybdate transport system substrate-binding protein
MPVAGSDAMTQPAVAMTGLVSMGVQGVLDAAGPAFERASGHRLALSFSTSKALGKRMTDGETCDLVIATPLILDPLLAAGLIVAGSVVPLATSGVGIAVRKGEPKPDISTPEAFVAALVAARTIGHSDPAGGGASGVHFCKLITRLGLADAITPKCRLAPAGTHSADLLIRGEVDVAVQQVPELAYVDGIDVVGPLPADLQEITVFAGAIHAKAEQSKAAQALIDYLRSGEGVAAIKAQRLEPA